MKLFCKAPDGGANSGVTGYFLIEWKSAFSIVLLRFNIGTREAFHEHAFNALTLWLRGRVREHTLVVVCHAGPVFAQRDFEAGQVKFTARDKCHQIEALTPAWAISVRGRWRDRWREWRPDRGEYVTLTHGRKIVG